MHKLKIYLQISQITTTHIFVLKTIKTITGKRYKQPSILRSFPPHSDKNKFLFYSITPSYKAINKSIIRWLFPIYTNFLLQTNGNSSKLLIIFGTVFCVILQMRKITGSHFTS